MSNEVKLSGPIFSNPNKRLAKALNTSLLDIAVLGSQWVKKQLYKGHGFRTGYLKGSIGGGLVKNLHAQIDAGELHKGRNVVYAAWVEGVSKANKRSRFKGYFMFRNVFNKLKKQPKEVKDIMEYNIRNELN